MDIEDSSCKSEPIDMPTTSSSCSGSSSSGRDRGARDAPVFTSPQSKRNLEMIAEAIRHLEGDHLFLDSRHIPGEDSQTESSTSDQEDMKSECSERDDSPLSRSPDVNVGLTHATATLCVTATDHPQFPHVAGMHLVNPQIIPSGVIVKSSQ